MCFKLLPNQETLSVDAIIDKMLGSNKSSTQILTVLNHCFSGKTVSKEYIQHRKLKLQHYRKKLAKLLEIPKIEQRTDEWYAIRNTLITASEFAQALDKAKFGTQKQFYKKKCGMEPSINLQSPPLIWGIKYEPVACSIYAKRTGQTIHEFGLLRHPTIPFFGASPDGITNNGIMLEIKCPYQRSITGDVPLQYYYQMQGQLSVCELEECDYVECGIKEVTDMEEMWAELTLECGIIIEQQGVKTYSPVFGKGDEENARLWMETNSSSNSNTYNPTTSPDDETENTHTTTEGKEETEPIITFWVLKTYNTVRIYRDDKFLQEQFALLEEVWQKVCEYRQNPSELTARRNTKDSSKSDYMFLDD